MLRLLAQLQESLQLGYKTNITQICQKIELYGSPTSKDFKKLHSSRQLGGLEMQRCTERHGQVERIGVEAQRGVQRGPALTCGG